MRLLLLPLLLLLGACSMAPSRPPAADPEATWDAHRAAVLAVDEWRLNGRIGVRSDGSGWHASLFWHQDDGRYDIRIVAPLGQGSVRLVGDDRQVELTTGGGEQAVAANPSLLLHERLGWRVPVEALRYWAIGLPAPGSAAKTLDDAGRLTGLYQAGWSIRFHDYREKTGLELPGLVVASHPDAEVRLVVNDWTPITTAAAR
jgi:outer membrane lipoprotein LolB